MQLSINAAAFRRACPSACSKNDALHRLSAGFGAMLLRMALTGDVPGKPGRRWVLVGYLDTAPSRTTFRDWLNALSDENGRLLVLDPERDYRLAYSPGRRRWGLYVR